MGQPLNYLMHELGLYRKGLRYNRYTVDFHLSVRTLLRTFLY
jgi:hypothetical protein